MGEDVFYNLAYKHKQINQQINTDDNINTCNTFKVKQ